jgi:ABC-type sugar transport systems, ATPase components
VFDNKVTAVSDFNLDIEDKEFVVFVGPSGCGKSTTLRMIAGLEEITSGELYIDGEKMNDVQPKDRNIAMVFQNYALYPHMTVYENMAFSLKMRNVPHAEIKEKVIEAAEILGITEYLERKPKALSGGQRQRVALGRAIVRNPKVFLLDEPLSNLDAKLRTAMRTEITKLHNKLQTTFIYVTHDQIEAMTMGTRIVVMKDGFIQQIDTPQNLYDYPVNKFVASFIGTPQMNFFDGRLNADGTLEFAKSQKLKLSVAAMDKLDKERVGDGVDIVLGVRVEDLHVAENGAIVCRVEVVEELGSECLLYCSLDLNSDGKIVGDEGSLVVKTEARTPIKRDTVIRLDADEKYLHIFDKATGVSLLSKYSDYAAKQAIVSAKEEERKAFSENKETKITQLAAVKKKLKDIIRKRQ